MLKTWRILTSLSLILGVLLTSCAAPAKTGAPLTESTAAPVEVKDFTTWTEYDQDNTDPASDERVGNEYLRGAIPQFNEAYQGKWNWVNVPKAFDKLAPELTAAVIAGGDVPDIIETLRVVTLAQNGVLQDLSEWAKTQPWFDDLDPAALGTCTVDGKLLCIPVAIRPNLTYVWADRYPNGYPTTPEQFLIEAERLKGEGFYAITFFGSTAFSGNAFGRAYYDFVTSFGGRYDDGHGNLNLNTPETVAAIQFLREIIAKGYVPDVAFAGGFQEEEAFKDSSAGAIPTGLFGYRYMNPLTAPDGTKYAKGNAQDMLDAIAAGDILLRPMFAPEGKTPGCGLLVSGLGIPTGALNVEAAHDFISWIMTNQQVNADYVSAIGAGFPALKTMRSYSTFQSPFYVQAAEAINQSYCTDSTGSLLRQNEAAVIVSNVFYKLVKEDPTADIVSELIKADAEYNKGN